MSENGILIYNKRRLPKPSVVYDTYWRFAAERQQIFFNRLEHPQDFPWTDDPILRKFKFTNVYRAADRTSQYLIKQVIYNGTQISKELIFRILLFKLFNKIETWESIKKEVGIVDYQNFDYNLYSEILEKIRLNGDAIYSGAYIMASAHSNFGKKFKYQNHLKLLEKMMEEDVDEKILCLNSLEDLYNLLKSFPTIGNFLAYQYAIDINYSEVTNFSEMDFVVAGPGAKDGIRKCFSDMADYTEEDIIKMMADSQESEFTRLNLEFKTLWGRRLQLIDCQNLFCEVDKYSRLAHPEIFGLTNRRKIKQKFSPTSLDALSYFFPPKWDIITPIS